jgi:hypothetical protein
MNEGSAGTFPEGPTPPVPPHPTGPIRRRPPTTLIVVAVVVSVAVVVALVLAASGGLFSTGPSSAAVPESSSTALAQADALARSTAGGPWSLSEVAGVGFTAPYSNDTPPTNSSSCGVSDFSGINLPAYTGNYSSGKLPNWVFTFVDLEANTEIVVFVQNGHASLVEKLSGPGCLSGGPGTSPLPATFVNSTQVAAALLETQNFSAFVRANPSANAELALFSAELTPGPEVTEWLAIYTTCDLQSPRNGPANGSFAYGDVNASTGLVFGTSYSTGENCTTGMTPGNQSGSMPIGTAFAAGNPLASNCPTGSTFARNGCNAGDFTYSLTVESSTVDLDNVLFEVETSVGDPYAPGSPAGFSILNGSGYAEAEYAVPSSGGLVMTMPFGTFGTGITGATPITSVDSILIDMGTANPTGLDLQFVVLGTNGYSGTTAPVALG